MSVCETAIRSQPYQTHFEVWSFLLSKSAPHLFIFWSRYQHNVHTHMLQVDFPFCLAGSPHSGTAISLSWHSSPRRWLPGQDWQNPKKLGPDASFTVYRNVSAVISWRPSLEIQPDTLMKALWCSVAERACSNCIYLKQLFSWLSGSAVARIHLQWFNRSQWVLIY